MICKKGHSGLPNQNSVFTLVDCGLKIFCVADGHGVNGNKVSSFALSMLLNYIRNVKGSFFVA
jgi:serine/threonine protein phosphatase PrpC